MDYPIVTNLNEGTIQVGYLIRSHEYADNGAIEYDWVTERTESDEFYPSVEEAEADVQKHFGN